MNCLDEVRSRISAWPLIAIKILKHISTINTRIEAKTHKKQIRLHDDRNVRGGVRRGGSSRQVVPTSGHHGAGLVEQSSKAMVDGPLLGDLQGHHRARPRHQLCCSAHKHTTKREEIRPERVLLCAPYFHVLTQCLWLWPGFVHVWLENMYFLFKS